MASSPEAISRCSSLTLPDGARNPFVFLVGVPRSGTTMLKRMVAAHPLVTITRETHWIPGFYERRRGLTEAGIVTPAVLDKLFAHKRFEHIRPRRGRLVNLLAHNPDLTYAELVEYLFDRFAKRQGKPLVGDKTPTYVARIPTLSTLWPRAKFVHLIRDGRDVLLSIRKWRKVDRAAGLFETWADDPVVTAALWWKALVGLGVEEGRRLGSERYHEIKYENLVAVPGAHCRQLAEFLGLVYDPAMESYYDRRPQKSDGESANAVWLPPTPGLRDWRRDLPEEDAVRFEAAAGDMLDLLGYVRAHVRPAAKLVRQVAAIRERFATHASRRKFRLPVKW